MHTRHLGLLRRAGTSLSPCFRQAGSRLRASSTSTSSPARPQIIFSGIQPTGVPHLGNYLGALQQWVRLQNTSPPSTTLLFSIVDLHALTSRQPPASRLASRRSLLASFLAIGLDPSRSILFHQSAVPAHSELHWILSCDASMGWLSRMTQWKSKLSEEELASLLNPTPNPKQRERMKLGLFSYPVLQAADILVHRATHVPVGEDQLQHIEFASNCARQFNHAFGGGDDAEGKAKKEILVPPEFVVSPAKRVMSLTEPEKKMSKSHPLDRSRIMLDDSEEDIIKKFKTALTDSLPGISYDRANRPGVTNLIEIMSHMSPDNKSCEQIAEDLKDSSLRVLKEEVARVVVEHLKPMREEYMRLMSENNKRLEEIAEEGAIKARESADKTMRLVREAIGI